MNKIISVLLAVTLVVGVGSIGVVSVMAEDGIINVPADYSTIQEAINAASDGDTVMAAAGLYKESVVINKSLTLKGAQAGVDARTRSGAETIIEPDEEEIGISIITAHGRVVVIDGLTVRNAEHGIGTPGTADPDMAADITVKNVRILNSSVFGISLAWILEATVEYCYVEGARQAINAGDLDPFPPTVATFRNNEIVNTEFGITGYLKDSVIEGNLVRDFATGGVGISGQFLNTEIKNNTVTGYVEGGGMTFESHYGRALSENVNVAGNTFTENSLGIYVFDTQTELIGITVNFNNIAGNSWYGVWNDGGETLNATKNWWGDASGPSRVGPGDGDAISSKVLYSPWLGAEPGTEPMTWGVNPTSSIQAAIDAAGSGDTIRVAAGEYDAFVVEARANISIIGAEGATVTAGDWVSIDRGPIGDAWSMAAVKDSQNINIQGIDFDGTGLSKEEVIVGIVYVNSTGRIANLMVENTMGAELGVGVAIIGDAGTSSVNLADVTIKNSMAGVIIWGAEANLDGCTITEMSPNGGFGIMGSGVGVVIGIPGDAWQGPSTVKVKGSTISNNNDIGIYVCDESTLEARFNNIVDNAGLGVLNDGGQRVDALYNWWGDRDEGPFSPTANSVSDGVDVWPWTGGRAVTKTVTDDIIDARAEADTVIKVTGTARVTVVRYLYDPAANATAQFITQGECVDAYVPDTDQVTRVEVIDTATLETPPLLFPLGEPIDVSADDVSQASEIEIRVLYSHDDLARYPALLEFQLYWFNAGKWEKCSLTNSEETNDYDGYAGYIRAIIRDNTTPKLTQLTGTRFGGYGSPPAIPQFGCFISTAAYGTDTAEEIAILREFRDTVLLPTDLGAAFVALYHRTSPPIANFISRHEVLRTAVRVGLVDPIVAVLEWSQDLWLARGSPG